MVKAALFFLLLCCIACNLKVKEPVNYDRYENPFSSENIEINRKGMEQKDWKCENLQGGVTCYPRAWHAVNQNSFYFFAYIDTINKKEYYVVGKFPQDSIYHLELDYLSEVYRQLTLDTLEMLISFDLKKLTFRNDESYYGEYVTQESNGVKYVTYSMVFRHSKYIYDITVKIVSFAEVGHSYLFEAILYNFQLNNKHVFRKSNSILKVTQLGPSDLF